VAYNKIGDLAGALKSYKDSLAITERLAKSHPGDARTKARSPGFYS
jgi:hypothetical protein